MLFSPLSHHNITVTFCYTTSTKSHSPLFHSSKTWILYRTHTNPPLLLEVWSQYRKKMEKWLPNHLSKSRTGDSAKPPSEAKTQSLFQHTEQLLLHFSLPLCLPLTLISLCHPHSKIYTLLLERQLISSLFFYWSCTFWNSLPASIVNSHSSSFKSRLTRKCRTLQGWNWASWCRNTVCH